MAPLRALSRGIEGCGGGGAGRGSEEGFFCARPLKMADQTGSTAGDRTREKEMHLGENGRWGTKKKMGLGFFCALLSHGIPMLGHLTKLLAAQGHPRFL